MLDSDDVDWAKGFLSDPNTVGDAHNVNPELSSIPAGTPGGSSVYANHLETYATLVDKLFEFEFGTPAFSHVSKRLPVVLLAQNILMSINTRLIHALILGDLPRQYRVDADMRKAIDRLWRDQQPAVGNRTADTKQPVIYIQYIVDRDGYGLNAAQRRTVIDSMLKYCDGNDPDHAFRIDSAHPGTKWQRSLSNLGRRRYLARTTHENPSHSRQHHLRAFYSLWAQNTDAHPADARLIPLREVGYTNGAMRRLLEHRCHRSSNFLMNLVEAICAVEYGDTFHLSQYVVTPLFKAQQASLAEIIITRLADGKHD